MFFHMVFRDGLTTEQNTTQNVARMKKITCSTPEAKRLRSRLENHSSIDDLPMLIPIYKRFPMDIRSQNTKERHLWIIVSILTIIGGVWPVW